MDGFARFDALELKRLPAEAPFEQQLSCLRDAGVLILEGAMNDAQLADLDREFDPWFECAPGGEGSFFGRRTRRFGGLLAKGRSALHLVLHERVLSLCERVLIADDVGPARCDRIQLSIGQGIGIGPDEPEQVVHRDRDMHWVSTDYELLVNAMFCLDDFTIENGGTRFVPGSCAWGPHRWPERHEIISATAPRGSVILWLGSMMHGGGANHTEKLRRGIILSYNVAWLAQGEKLQLTVPPACAKTLPERAQRLIGYQTHRPSLGWIEGRDPIEWLRGEFTSVAPAGDHLRSEHAKIVDEYYAETPRRAEALP